jgi:hypothetical protein
MEATVGDQLHMRGRTVGTQDRYCEVIEVRGKNGAPPYVVRYSDGHEALVYPGPDCVVEHSEQ